jgi:hypothetical protein
VGKARIAQRGLAQFVVAEVRGLSYVLVGGVVPLQPAQQVGDAGVQEARHLMGRVERG